MKWNIDKLMALATFYYFCRVLALLPEEKLVALLSSVPPKDEKG